MFAPWAAGLNPAQAEAVHHTAPALMVVAGAGTGKTRTLASRVARLIGEGVRPERIVLLTFTRRAAQEMLARVASLTDQRAAAQVWGGTFHSVANRLLRRFGPGIALPANFTVIDQADTTDMFGLVRNEEGLGEGARRFPRKETIAGIYSRMVNSQAPLATVLDETYPWCGEHREALAELFTGYTSRKRANQVLDYDDLLLFWRALGTTPGTAAAVHGLFDHVLVDEYQDTNRVQADIVAAMADSGTHITVVGDDAQAIYGFRAATVHNMREFTARFDGAAQVTLEQNYRSTPPILAAANSVLAASPHHIDKELWSERAHGPLPQLVTCADETAQSIEVCDAVLDLREQGFDLRDQAVLFRTGHHSDGLELELSRRDIPFVKFGGLKFLEAAHVKDLLALLRVLDNPADQLAWNRVLALLPRVGPATIRRVTEDIGLATEPAGALTRFLAGAATVPAAAGHATEELRAAWAECTDDQHPPAAAIERLREWCAVVFPDRYRDVDARLADLDQLAAGARQYSDRSRFLTELTLDPPEGTGDLAQAPHLDDDYLILSTIHSAKGGEWRAVHLIHAADGNIPSDMALSDREGLEEERRLLYVALTRAKDELRVSFPVRFHIHRHGLDDRHNLAPLSRFLDPIRDRFDERTAGSTVGPDAAIELAAVSVSDEVDTFLHSLWEA